MGRCRGRSRRWSGPTSASRAPSPPAPATLAFSRPPTPRAAGAVRGGGLQGRGSKGSRSSCTHIRCGRRRPHQPTHQPIPPHYPTSGNKLHFSEFEQSPNLAESVYIGSPFPQLAVSSAFLRPTFKHWVKSLYKIELDFAYYFYLFASTSRVCPQGRGFGGGGEYSWSHSERLGRPRGSGNGLPLGTWGCWRGPSRPLGCPWPPPPSSPPSRRGPSPRTRPDIPPVVTAIFHGTGCLVMGAI